MQKRKLKHDYNAIYQKHLAGETILNISKDTGIHVQSIYTHFQKNNWEYNKNIQIRQAGYVVDDNYLDNIDNEDKAYFLGWLLSDGCVLNNRITLKLKYGDEYIIKEMFNKFSSGYKIGNDKNSRYMSLSSTKMVCTLKKLGCVENKTEVGFDLPNISKDLFRHFVRGYFDGDGSVGIRSKRHNQIQVSICSIDNKFLTQLQEKLREHNISSVIYKENRSGKLFKRPDGSYSNNKDMFRLMIRRHKEKLKFYEFLYNDCSIKLMRKYDKYKKYYINTLLILKRKNSNIVQCVDGDFIINYELINGKFFNYCDEVDEQLVLNMFREGKCEYAIHKETKIGRRVIKRILLNL